MSQRAIWISFTAAVAGCLFGGALAFWLAIPGTAVAFDHCGHKNAQARQFSALQDRFEQVISWALSNQNSISCANRGKASLQAIQRRKTTTRAHDTAANQNTPRNSSALLALRTSPPASLSRPLITGSAGENKQARASNTGRQTHDDPQSEGSDVALNFHLPGAVRQLSAQSRRAAQQLIADRLNALDLTPTQVSAPDIDLDKLFNKRNGLRGFMTQRWINQRVGFQSGVGITESRLRQKGSDLEENLAVGVGLLFSF